MAKINKSEAGQKNKNVTPKGTMPKDQLKRFGLNANLGSSDFADGETFHKEWDSYAKRKWIKKMTQQVVTYRMMGACKTETKLPAPLKNAVRYFSRTMGKFDDASKG